jgi:two-component system, LuxR family, sensor kinase FixL
MVSPDDPPAVQYSDLTLFQTLMATAVDGIVVIDHRGIVLHYNPACERLFQYTANEVVGRNVKTLMPAPYRQEHDGYLDRYQRSGEAHIIGIGREVHGRRKDGTSFPMYLSVGAATLNEERIFVGIIHDLSALKTEIVARLEQRDFLALIVESANDAIVSKTLDGVVTSWNPAAATIFGYSAEEMIGKSIAVLFPPDRLSEEEEFVGRVRKGGRVDHYETVRRHKDGHLIDVSVTLSPIRDAEGTIIGAAKTARDITERKAAEASLTMLQNELSHVARLTEMGQFSASLAHELNQPLAAITNYLNVAKRLLAKPDGAAKAGEALAKAAQQALRAGQIIRRLREFIEKRETNRTLENINKIAEDSIALGMVGAKVANIRLHTDFAEDPPPVLADKIQIQQIIINLLRNAAEAMADSPRREIFLSTEPLGEDMVQLSVADTGPGIPGDVAKRLFQPFVTTKNGGMGIGLAISRTIAEAHGGQLEMTPNPGGGTVFRIRLPVAESK